jgi:hypothetical protein
VDELAGGQDGLQGAFQRLTTSESAVA